MLKAMMAAAAAVSLISLGACEQSTTVETDSPAENAAEDLGNDLEQAGNDLENAADEAGENIEQAGDNAADAVNDATDGNPNTNP